MSVEHFFYYSKVDLTILKSMTVKTCSGARLQTDTLESLQGESCHKMQVPTGGIGDELDKERQRERVGNLDALGSA